MSTAGCQALSYYVAQVRHHPRTAVAPLHVAPRGVGEPGGDGGARQKRLDPARQPKWLCTTSTCSRAINRAAASDLECVEDLTGIPGGSDCGKPASGTEPPMNGLSSVQLFHPGRSHAREQ
jgi:hypothetical protein